MACVSLEVSQLRVRRGADLALDGVSFDLEPGTLTALVGPNGAGKSTLLQAIEGQLPIACGSIRLDGQALTPALVRQQLALMPQRGEIAWHFPISVRELGRAPPGPTLRGAAAAGPAGPHPGATGPAAAAR